LGEILVSFEKFESWVVLGMIDDLLVKDDGTRLILEHWVVVVVLFLSFYVVVVCLFVCVCLCLFVF